MTPFVRPGLLILIGALVAGVVEAWIWASIAPGVQYQVFSNKTWAALPTETQHIFFAFAMFALIGLFVGAAIALVGWQLRPLRGVVMLLIIGVAAAAGSALAATLGVAWATGTDPGSVAVAGVSEVVTAPAVLTGWPAYVAAPAAAVVVYTFLVAWNGLPQLGRSAT